MIGAPPINEAVNFLDKFAPQALQRLQVELPQLGGHLELGGLADALADPQIIARAKVSLTTLQEVISLCDRGMAEAQKRLKRSKNISLLSSVAATLGSASVVASLAASHPQVGMVAGCVSLAGSIGALLADNITKMPNATLKAFDVYQGLVGLRVESRILESDLSTLLEPVPDKAKEEMLSGLIGKANDFLRRAYELMSALESVVSK